MKSHIAVFGSALLVATRAMIPMASPEVVSPAF